MRKFLRGLLAIACSLLLLTGLHTSQVFARDITITKPVKEKLPVKPQVTKAESKGRSCEEIKESLTVKAEKLLQKAELFKAAYDEAALINEYGIDADLLVSKQAAVESAIEAARADIAALACPVSTFKTTMKQLEEDIRYVNSTLNDYRRTLKGLKGKAERKEGSAKKPVLGVDTQVSCALSQVSAKKQQMNSLVVAAENLAAHYTARAKITDMLTKTLVQSKQLVFESALRKAKQDISALLCTNGSMAKGVTAFKGDMLAALSALKGYRQVLFDNSLDK